MSCFPLYDNLIQNIDKKAMSCAQKEDFISKIKKVDDNCKELIYALVYFYNINSDKSAAPATGAKKGNSLPYNGFMSESQFANKKNITWNFNGFPHELKHLLYKFVNMHIKNIGETCDHNTLHV